MSISRGWVIDKYPEISSEVTISLSKIQKSSAGPAGPRSVIPA
jgi:hypothetical protein